MSAQDGSGAMNRCYYSERGIRFHFALGNEACQCGEISGQRTASAEIEDLRRQLVQAAQARDEARQELKREVNEYIESCHDTAIWRDKQLVQAVADAQRDLLARVREMVEAEKHAHYVAAQDHAGSVVEMGHAYAVNCLSDILDKLDALLPDPPPSDPSGKETP